MAEEESDTILEIKDGIYTANGSMNVDGNLEVQGQIQSKQLKVREDDTTILTSVGSSISFRKACMFTKPVQFNNGATTIGVENTYNSAYVGSATLQAGERVVVGDSLFKISAPDRKVVADTFTMSLKNLVVDGVSTKKSTVKILNAESAKVSEELIVKELYSDVVKTNKLYIDQFSCLSFNAANQAQIKDLVITGTAILQNDLTIQGKTSSNGAALTVNGGALIANYGIISHTRKNEFQCLEIMGSGKSHDTCLKVDKEVDSLFEGNVTIQDSNLVLDNSKLVTDNIVVTQLGENGDDRDENFNGVQITTLSNWDSYMESMVSETDTPRSPDPQYDPYATVDEAMQRNDSNYRNASLTVKTILNPINYLMEKKSVNIPKQFSIGNGTYRIDSNGNILAKNLVAQKARFSELEAYRFKVNRLNVDKLITTAVASNVVHTDNLLKSEGIAEFSGSVNSMADVFVTEGGKVNIGDGSSVTFQNGSKLAMKNGASLEMGTDTQVKMSGDVEMDLSKLVFVDSKTGRKFRISFRDAHPFEGHGIVMDYEEVKESTPSTTRTVEQTRRDARELNEKLKALGL